MDLYGGDFLTGFILKDSVNFDDWQISQTQSLQSDLISALERLVHYLSEKGEFKKAITYAQKWLEMDRINEGIHRQLMELYAKTGERSAALEQYEGCVKILKEKLGVSPQESTALLYEAIKEFGKILKFEFILRYIADVDFRQAIEKQMNKIESSNRFSRAVSFGGSHEFLRGEKTEQEIAEGCRRLIKNAIVCWNYLYISQKIADEKDLDVVALNPP